MHACVDYLDYIHVLYYLDPYKGLHVFRVGRDNKVQADAYLPTK